MKRAKTGANFSGTLIAILIMLGVALATWGSALNSLAEIANDGEMPIVYEFRGKTTVIGADGFVDVASSRAKLLWLADRFHYRFPQFNKSISTPSPVRWWISTFGYPADGMLRSFSVGDTMVWVGSLMFLLLLPSLLILVPVHARANHRAFGNWRGRPPKT